MFKATPVLLKTIRRLPLSTKQSKKDYYKGNNVGNMGSIDQFGRFKVEWDKVRTYVYPEDGAKVRMTHLLHPAQEHFGLLRGTCV